jgi:hypothetical protein
MTLNAPPLSEEIKETILTEHPAGVWVVLAEELPQSREPDLAELAGHPTTNPTQAAERSRAPR